MIHPNLRVRRPRSAGGVVRAMVLAPVPAIAAWIEDELSQCQATWQLGRTIEQAVAGLTEDPPPRAQLLIVDLDALAPGDLLGLHAIRDLGWFGLVYGLGSAPPELRRSLGIHRLIAPPYGAGTLAEAVAAAGLLVATTRMERMPGL
jgi:hypothetical protein